MASILRADNITTVAGTGNISLNTGNKIVSPDVGGIVAPGQVVQVQSTKIANAPGSSSSWYSTTSTTAANSGLNVIITPKFATSKLFVQITGNLNITAPASSGVGAQLWIYRDGININSGGNNSCAAFIYNVNTPDQYASYSSSALINASSTTSTTFSLWVARWSSTETVRLGGHDGQTTLTVWEIAQ